MSMITDLLRIGFGWHLFLAHYLHGEEGASFQLWVTGDPSKFGVMGRVVSQSSPSTALAIPLQHCPGRAGFWG